MKHFIAAATSSPVSSGPNQIPLEFWLRVVVGIIVVVVAVSVFRRIAKSNKILLTVIILVALTIVGFNWIYERNEPKWATPVVQWLSGFMPSKGKVEQKKSGM